MSSAVKKIIPYVWGSKDNQHLVIIENVSKRGGLLPTIVSREDSKVYPYEDFPWPKNIKVSKKECIKEGLDISEKRLYSLDNSLYEKVNTISSEKTSITTNLIELLTLCSIDAFSNRHNYYLKNYYSDKVPDINNPYGLFTVTNKKNTSLKDLIDVIEKINLLNLSNNQNLIVKEALNIIRKRLENKLNSIFSLFFVPQAKKNEWKEALDFINKKINEIKKISEERQTFEIAKIKFFKKFKKFFGSNPTSMNENDIKKIDFFGKKIWKSQNVQASSNKYKTFNKLMQEFYIGSHMIFEDADIDEYKEFLKNKNIKDRVSTHYGKVGSHMQHSLKGKQLPETLFARGDFAISEDNEVMTQKTKGAYAKLKPGFTEIENVIKRENLCFLPFEEQKKRSKIIHAIWMQNENRSDGKSWLEALKNKEYLAHRLLDVPYYLLLKLESSIIRKTCSILKKPISSMMDQWLNRVQVTHYTSKKMGAGLSDNMPIYLRKRSLKEE